MSELTDVIQYPEKAVEKMAALLARAEKAEEEVMELEKVAGDLFRSLCAYLDYAPSSMADKCYEPWQVVESYRNLKERENE